MALAAQQALQSIIIPKYEMEQNMYNPLLYTFVTVIDCGSFAKAAEALYISPTAVMKQVNALEQHLDLKLTARTPSGIRPTEAGVMIYRDAKFLMDYSQKSVSNAQAAAHAKSNTFCVGTSLLNPAKPFMDNHKGILAEIEQLGKKFDFLIGVCDSREWLSRCHFLPLGCYQKMIAVSREHRLAGKKRLRIEDLYGETLMMVRRGDSKTNDLIRRDLERNHPQIQIEDTPPFYDLSVFNRCAETGKALLTIACWQEVHPALISLPVEWDYCIPYGLLYSFDAPADVLRFVRAAEAAAEKLRTTST